MSVPPSPALPHSDRSFREWMRTCVEHLSALVYLRFRLRKNSWDRDSILGRVITIVFFATAALGALLITGIGLLAGFFVHRNLDASGQLFFWNTAVFGFVVVWLVHFSSELFRNDALTLDRIMHLPISPGHAFAINYVSSLINFPIVYFTGFMSGAILGSTFAIGPRMLLAFVPLAVYVVLVTSITSQFQGALAAWLANPRRRRAVMVLFSFFFVFVIPVLSIGIPNLIRSIADTARARTISRAPLPMESLPMAPLPGEAVPMPPLPGDALPMAPLPGEVMPMPPLPGDVVTLPPLPGDLNRAETDRQQGPNDREMAIGSERITKDAKIGWLNEWSRVLEWVQILVPPMWFAACASSLADYGWHAVWITPGMLVLAYASMRRNYQTTVRYYQDGFNSYVADSGHGSRDAGGSPVQSNFIERSLPWTSPTASAIAMQTWLTAWRAPELKLMLLAPLLQPLVGLFLIRLWSGPQSEEMKTMVTLGLAGFGLFTSSGVLGNQFGMDRAGFRTWVLSPIPRFEILHGRNLAYGLPAWLTGAVMTLVIGVWWGLPLDKLGFLWLTLAAYVPFYLLVSDLMSILSPFGLPVGALQPKEFSWKHVVISLLLSMLQPAMLAICAIPLGIEILASLVWPWMNSWPIALLIAVPWAVLAMALYWILLPWVGRCMSYWELEILKTVTATID